MDSTAQAMAGKANELLMDHIRGVWLPELKLIGAHLDHYQGQALADLLCNELASYNQDPLVVGSVKMEPCLAWLMNPNGNGVGLRVPIANVIGYVAIDPDNMPSYTAVLWYDVHGIFAVLVRDVSGQVPQYMECYVVDVVRFYKRTLHSDVFTQTI